MLVFLRTFQHENTYTKLHENAPFDLKNYKNFLGRGTAPSPDPSPTGVGDTPSPDPGTSTLVPSIHGKLPRMSSDPRNTETTPPYASQSSRFGSEPPSVEDDVDVWRYAILRIACQKRRRYINCNYAPPPPVTVL